MSYLLHIDSSSLGEASVSRQVAQSFRDQWQGPVVHRDLAASPVPHLTAAGVTARITDPDQHTPEQAKAAALQDELIEEFLGSRRVSVHGADVQPVDAVGVQGMAGPDHHQRTHHEPHRHSPAAGRPALVISARGGGYGPGTPREGLDHVVPTLEAVLGRAVLGLDVTTVIPELTMAPVAPALAPLLPLHEASMTAAHDKARTLATTFGTPRAA